MRATDERFTKEMRRGNLALGFLRRHVRTATICEWTGLSRTRVNKLRKTHVYEFPDVTLKRPSGRPPQTLCELLRSPRMRSEAAALGGLCRAFGVIPQEPVPDARRYLPSLSRGEHLCVIYDLYCDLVPSAVMTVDEAISLLMSLADGESHDIGRCTVCTAAILIDPLGNSRPLCMHCLQEARRAARRVPKNGVTDEADASPPAEERRGYQETLFEAEGVGGPREVNEEGG